MKVWLVDALGELGGLVLRDGMLLTTDTSGLGKRDPRYLADLLTTSGHELIHYLFHRMVNNYGASSPTTGLGPRQPARTQDVHQGQRLELGSKFVEILFGGVEPIWVKCSPDFAEQFLERCKQNHPLPLFTKEELEGYQVVKAQPAVPGGLSLRKNRTRMI